MTEKDQPAGSPEPSQSGSLDPRDERMDLVRRIESSTPFRKSPRLRKFLMFVAERCIAGHAEEITEHEIGWKVFERGPNHNPSDDSIVRTTARQLRSKVKEYFETEGSGEDLILEIPKGRYVPVFLKREREISPEEPAPEHVPEIFDSSSGDSVAARRWQIVATGLGIATLCFLLFAGRLELGSQNAVAAPRPTVVSTVVSPRQQLTRVVVGDFGLALMSAATKHYFSVEDYANRSNTLSAPPGPATPIARYLWGLFGSGQIISLPDAIVAGGILRTCGEEGNKVVLQQARQVNASDLRSGNFILLSSPIASPWITLFEDKLNFRYRVRFDKAPSQGLSTEFENLHPRPGEKLLYPAAPSVPEFGLTYGLVARVPNLMGTGKVLLICGLTYTGFEAAGEYATDPNAAIELAHLLKVNDINQAPDFEVLLETYSIEAAPQYVRVAAFRRITD